MIENKLVTIKKSNTFDKGWALFEKYNIPIVNTIEPGAKTVTLAEIVQAITFSKSVDIILKEPCLPSNIVSELQWVSSRGVKLRLLAKSQDIIDKYSAIKFAETKVISFISVNFLAIFGEKPFYVSLSDYYIRTDGAIWMLHFGVNYGGNRWQILDGATRVVVIEQSATLIYKDYIDECIRRNIPIDYVVPVDKFSEELCKRVPKEVNLCVSENIKPGLLVFGKYYAYTKDTVRFFCGDTYRNLRLADDISTSRLRSDTYCCLNGSLHPLVIEDTKVVKRTVQVELMSDFVTENFDRSETELHNDYSAEVSSVEYQFTLVPPKFDNSYQLSDMYAPLIALRDAWKKHQCYDLRQARKTLGDIITQCDLLKVMDQILQFDKWLTEAVGKYDYHGYSDSVSALLQNMTDAFNNYLQYFEQIFVKINGSTSDSKFDKLEADIQQYRNTIDEKNLLIEQGKNVLENKQAIERLKLEISKLEVLKKNFEGKSVAQIGKAIEEYRAKCQRIVDGASTESVNDDSIGNVIHQSESRAEAFERFTENYLVSLRNYLQNTQCIVEQLSQQDIPEDYPVYDKNGERYIVINDLSEYETTLPIQTKYQLKCLAR